MQECTDIDKFVWIVKTFNLNVGGLIDYDISLKVTVIYHVTSRLVIELNLGTLCWRTRRSWCLRHLFAPAARGTASQAQAKSGHTGHGPVF